MHDQPNITNEELWVKQKALTSLYFHAKEICGFNRLTSPENEEWCWTLEERHKRLLLLAPRLTYKTTVHAKAYPIWELDQDPNLRILLVNEVESNSIKWLRAIKGIYERNVTYRHFFGDRVGRAKWGEKEIIIKQRTANPSEPSIGAIGFGGTLTSAHYDRIIVDDLVGPDDRASATTRAKKIEWFKELVSLIDQDGLIIILGTRWHYADLYDYIINDLNPQLKPEDQYKIMVQSCYDQNGKTAFPNHFSDADLDRIKIETASAIFSANYVNDPLQEGARVFSLDDLEYFNLRKWQKDFEARKEAWDGNGSRVDPEGDPEPETLYFGYLDPSLGKAGSDYPAFIVLGVGDDGYMRVVDAILELMPPSQQVKTIIDLQKAYDFEVFGIEGNGFQELLEQELEEASAKEGVYVPIELINHRGNKQVRIENAEPTIKRYVRFRDDWRTAYPKLMTQLIQFPVAGHDDGPDALEGAVSLVKGSRLQFY